MFTFSVTKKDVRKRERGHTNEMENEKEKHPHKKNISYLLSNFLSHKQHFPLTCRK